MLKMLAWQNTLPSTAHSHPPVFLHTPEMCENAVAVEATTIISNLKFKSELLTASH